MRYLVLLVAVFVFVNYTSAQKNTLWLTNGKKITIGNFEVKNDHSGDSILVYNTLKGKEKEKYFDEVFSVTDLNGKENIIYHQNIRMGETLTVNQMKSYVNGRYDGRNTKISPWVPISAGLAGFGSAFIPQPSVSENSQGIPVGVLVPFGHATVVGGFSTPDKILQKNYPDKMNDEYYLLGADQSLRKKRVRSSLIIGLASFIAGSITVIAIN